MRGHCAVSPANKDRVGGRQSFAAKCVAYLQQGIGVVIVDVVTACKANLHEELFDLIGMQKQAAWQSATGLYAVTYRALKAPDPSRLEVWAECLALGETLPVMPLWLSLDLCVPVRLEESYLATCQSLRISA